MRPSSWWTTWPRGAPRSAPCRTTHTVVLERFFDESGGMQLVVHSRFGSRINRAWGLALRKRFCRSFNFELQAAANEDSIVLSLGATHSFPLADAARFVSAASARDVLMQALLDAPMFEVRWRWNANISLAVPRFRGGKQGPAADPAHAGRGPDGGGLPGSDRLPREPLGPAADPRPPAGAPDHARRLTEAMDIDGLEAPAAPPGSRRSAGSRPWTSPSRRPSAAEILNARPYAFLDDAPAEERRTRAVSMRRHVDADDAADMRRIDPAAVARVIAECAPAIRDADELHDALVVLGYYRQEEFEAIPGTAPWLDALASQGRAARVSINLDPDTGATGYVVAAERFHEFACVHPGATAIPALTTPAEHRVEDGSRDSALLELLRARLQGSGPVTAHALADSLQVPESEVTFALTLLESEGVVLRGQFLPEAAEQWCERRILARIHRASIRRHREAVRPVPPVCSCGSCWTGSAFPRISASAALPGWPGSWIGSKAWKHRRRPGKARCCRRGCWISTRSGSITCVSQAAPPGCGHHPPPGQAMARAGR